jgi:putative transcriptional regulator
VKNRLRELRDEHGWTQGALADRLGVSRQTVNAVETGRYDPSLPLAFRIARLFGEPIEKIFALDDTVADTLGPDTGAGRQ